MWAYAQELQGSLPCLGSMSGRGRVANTSACSMGDLYAGGRVSVHALKSAAHLLLLIKIRIREGVAEMIARQDLPK
jgi:hypothetical protein